jgi:hypothetical protein
VCHTHTHTQKCKVNSPFAAAAVVKVRNRKFSHQNLAEAGREHAVQGLLEFASIIHTPYAVSVYMAQDRFLALLMMF